MNFFPHQSKSGKKHNPNGCNNKARQNQNNPVCSSLSTTSAFYNLQSKSRAHNPELSTKSKNSSQNLLQRSNSLHPTNSFEFTQLSLSRSFHACQQDFVHHLSSTRHALICQVPLLPISLGDERKQKKEEQAEATKRRRHRGEGGKKVEEMKVPEKGELEEFK